MVVAFKLFTRQGPLKSVFTQVKKNIFADIKHVVVRDLSATGQHIDCDLLNLCCDLFLPGGEP